MSPGTDEAQATVADCKSRQVLISPLIGADNDLRSPLSLVSTTEELLGRKSSGSGLEIREYGSRDPSH
jgi:hypothetical protein